MRGGVIILLLQSLNLLLKVIIILFVLFVAERGLPLLDIWAVVV
jgi:hypothetical protein